MGEQNANEANEKLIESIKKFSSAYNVLTPEGKNAFQNQITAQMRKMDDRTRKLYSALIDATKEGLDINKTIASMEKADRELKAGI